VSETSLYQVNTGDTLSSISAQIYGSSKYWTTIYWANKKIIKYANIIYVGQTLVIPTVPRVLAAPSAMSPVSPPQPQRPAHTVSATTSVGRSGVQSQTYQCGDGDGDGYDIPCSELHRSASTSAPTTSAPTISYTGSSSFQSCVIAAESGGNSQVMNASGHYGLYQFSYSTWIAYGGGASSFGNASVAEQNQVFANAMATAGGANNWSPYDGC
jgi:LysM repeat protein